MMRFSVVDILNLPSSTLKIIAGIASHSGCVLIWSGCASAKGYNNEEPLVDPVALAAKSSIHYISAEVSVRYC